MPKPLIANKSEARIVIRKRARTLELFDGDRKVKKCKMALGFSPIVKKSVEGDGGTPEGDFYIFTKNEKSSYFLSLGLSYPNVQDAKRGLAATLITKAEYTEIVSAVGKKLMPPQHTRLGGEIYIHGGGTEEDWTDGCIAVDDEDMAEIFEAATVGMLVTILP
ncbi:L,D-transpeptidase [soil metagenome]